MAVHIFETLILLFTIKICVANVETIEFRLGDRKIRVPLDKPALVELNEDGELEDIRIPDYDEINKHVYIPPKQTEAPLIPQRHYLEPNRQRPIQKTSEDYRHPSQPNIYNYYPPANQEFPQHHQHQPINQYPEAQFSRYPQDKQLLHQHYPVPNLQAAHYSEQIQTQPRYPNEYRNPYHKPTYDPHQRSHVQNLQHVPAYPNYGYRDPYYGNNFPRSHPQKNYVSNPYLPKKFDYNRHNPSTYHSQGPNLLNIRQFPGDRPLDSRIKRIEVQHDPIYSQKSPPIAPTNINLPLYPNLQNYKNALKPPQSSEYKRLPHNPPPEPAQAPVHAVQDKSRHARPYSVDTLRTLRPNLEQKSALRHIYRKPENNLKSHDLLRAPLTVHNRPIMTETKPTAPSKIIENMSSKIPVSPEVVYNPRLPSINTQHKVYNHLVNKEKKYKDVLQPTLTTSTMSPQEADRTKVKKIYQDHQYITTVLPLLNFATNFPTQDSSITNSAIPTSDSPSVLSSTMQAADTSPVQNSTDNSKFSSLTQYTTTKEPKTIETTDGPAQNAMIDVASALLPILETTASNPETSPSVPYTLSISTQNDASKIFINDTTTVIPVTNKPEIHSELSSDIQHKTTNFSSMNIETDSFVTTYNPVQKTNIRSNKTSNIHKLIKNKVTESLVPDVTSASFAPSFIQETTASTPELAPTLQNLITDAFEANVTSESLMQVSTDPVTDNPKMLNDQYSNNERNHNTTKTYSQVEITTTHSLANIAMEPSDNYIIKDAMVTLLPGEDTSFNNDEISHPSSQTTSDKTEKEIPIEQNASETLLQSSSMATQPSLPLTQNSTSNRATKSSDNDITTNAMVTLLPAEDTSFNNDEISHPSSQTTSDKTEKEILIEQNASETLLQSSSMATQPSLPLTQNSTSNKATEPSDNDITTDAMVTLLPAEDTSLINDEISHPSSQTTSDKTEKEIPIEQNASETLLQSSSMATQPSLPLTQNSTSNRATESSDNDITTNAMVTLLPAEDTSFNNDKISNPSSQTTLDKTEKEIPIEQNASETLLQSSLMATQPSLPLTQNSTSNRATEPSDNDITTDAMVTLLPAEDTSFNNDEISHPSSQTTSDKTEKEILIEQNASETLLQSSSMATQPSLPLTQNSTSNKATEPSDNDITTDAMVTLLLAEDISLINDEISHPSSQTTSDKTEKEIPIEQNASETLLQSSSMATQPSLPLTQNSTLTDTKGAVTTKGKTHRRPCQKHRKKKSGHTSSSGHRRRRRRTTTPSTISSPSPTTPDNIT